jgi:fructokinase
MERLAKQADAVCFGSLAQRSPVSRQTIGHFLRATGENCMRIFDINLRQHYYSPESIHESLGLADGLKLSDEEMPTVARVLQLPSGDMAENARELMRRYELKWIALTLGRRGSQLYMGQKIFEHPGYPVDPVDTVGAGDSFTAALVAGLLRGHEPARILAGAGRLASYVCSQQGATPAIPASLVQAIMPD